MNNTWMPREKWDALVRGENCPLCDEVKAKNVANEYGFYVADLRISLLRLCRNQYVKGYCVLIFNKHVREPYELTKEERLTFFEDMMLAGQALEKVFGADKMNFQILGNAVPHLHCHIEPRYLGDSAPHRPIDPSAEEVILTLEEYQKYTKDIYQALGNL